MKTDLKPSLNWDISLSPVTAGNFTNTGKKAIIRNDSSELLGIVGKKYEPVTNLQLMQFADSISRSGEFELKGFDEMNGGKIVIAYLKNTNPNLKINGCLNDEYMYICNSFDGTKRLHIGTASTLIRCTNQFTATLKVFSRKHTSFVDLTEADAEDIICRYKAKKASVYESFDGMESIRVDENAINRLIKEIHLMLSNDSKAIKQKDWTASPSMITLRNSIDREMKDLGNNAFGLFNGVTWYTTHEMRTTDPINSGMNGTASLINQKAYRFCNNLKRNLKQSI